MLTKISGHDIMPFRRPFELSMADLGLVAVRGRNLVSAAADANGVGKSSLVSAICWGYFGEDLRGRRADAVACRFTDGQCVMRLDNEDALGPWSVTRTRRPHSLTVEGIDGVTPNEDPAVTQARIEQRLGFGVRTFKNAVIFGQGTFDRFAAADQAEKMRMLDEIQGVDFRDALERAKVWRGQLEAALEQARQAARQARGNAELIEAEEERHRRVRDEFEQRKTERLRSVTTRIADMDRRVKDAEAQLRKWDADVARLERLRPLRETLTRANDACLALQKPYEDAKRELQVATRGRDSVQARVEQLLQRGECPTCKQPVKSREKAILKLFQPEVTQQVGVHRDAQLAFESAGEKYQESYSAYSDALLKLCAEVGRPVDQLFSHLAELEASASPNARVRLAQQEEQVRRDGLALAAEREKIAQETCDAVGAIERVRAMAAEERAKAAGFDQRAEKIEGVLAMARYWVEAFGDRGIRSLLVDSVAGYINERLAYHLEQLTCGELTLRMSATTALKSGKQKEGISFAAEWAWGGNGADDGSGGQDRRKDLAVFAAVQDLAETRSARPFPLKVWDEPADALDARGQEMFLRWVESQARSRGTGLLITHSEAIAAQVDADAVWTVVMDQDGAHVEVR